MPERAAATVAIGLAIAQLRVERGMSQQELGLESGVSGPHVCRIECGRQCPTYVTIRKLADGLETSPAKIVERAVELEKHPSGGHGSTAQ